MTDREWEVVVVPLVVGQRSVREKEWLETLKILGTKDGKKIISRLGCTLLNEHEKLFGSYWRQTFGPPSSLLPLLGKGLPVPPRGIRIRSIITLGSSDVYPPSFYLKYTSFFFVVDVCCNYCCGCTCNHEVPWVRRSRWKGQMIFFSDTKTGGSKILPREGKKIMRIREVAECECVSVNL